MSQFTKVPVNVMPSNTFDLGNNFTLSMAMGNLVPISCIECLPGDRHTYNNKIFTRLMPMVSPAMTKIDLTTATFFVPMRLIWPNSEKFFTNPVPNEDTPVAPYFDNIAVEVGTLGDYLGVPTRTVRLDDGTTHIQYDTISDISALPFGAMQKVYSDWFRDENLINEGEPTFEPLTDGVNPFVNLTNPDMSLSRMRNRAWRHDYFTSSLPFAQKGEAVEIPFGAFQDVPVHGAMDDVGQTNPQLWYRANHSNIPYGSEQLDIYGDGTYGAVQGTSSQQFLNMDPNGTLTAKTSLLAGAGVTVNTLRWTTALQTFLEKNARGGTRYTELVLQHFGQRSSDARLQRAEFLGFSTTPVTISEVLQTSDSKEDTTPLGEMGGHGISYGGSKSVHYSAEEHGFLITLVSARPKTSYMQGLSRMWRRKSPLDYAWPTFAQLGEQEVKNSEIYLSGNPTIDNQTFGYLPRYAEYRYESDRVAGEMRTSLTHWHQARIFDQTPALNEDFITCDPTTRIFAVNTVGNHPLILNVTNKHIARRVLPKYSIPAI